MIAKNEEEWIGQCIESVSSIVTEVILVDTGSTDRTVEIAERLGVRVIHEKWEDDFSPPRNISINAAKGEWILILDADEAIAARDLPEFQTLTADRGICTEFLQRHYTHDHRLSDFTPVKGEYPEWEKGQPGYFESNCVRLFPHGDGIHYRGRVHELVEHSIRDLGKHRIVRTGVRIHHFGHTRKVREKKDKGKIYSPLGESKIREEPHNWQAFFELGVEHNVNLRREQSVEAFNRAVEMNPSYLPTWLNRGYVFMELGRYHDAIADFKQALRLDPRSSEAYCNLGVTGMRMKDMKLAEESFLRALAINPVYINAMINLGKTYAISGRLSESIMVYRHAIRVLPACAAAKLDAGSVYLQSGFYNEAEALLRASLADDDKDPRTHFNLGQLYKITSQRGEALSAFERFLELATGDGLDPEMASVVKEVEEECRHLRAS